MAHPINNDAYSDWRATFRKLTRPDTEQLIDTVRTMTEIVTTELSPVDGRTAINRGKLEGLVLLAYMLDGLLEALDAHDAHETGESKLGEAIAQIRDRIVTEGSATALMGLWRQAAAARVEAEGQQESGGLVTPAATPESVVEALKQRAAKAEPVEPMRLDE